MSNATVVVGLFFGDEGKGVMTNYLASINKAGWVVRYNGGPQAAHNVIHKGRHHTFAQFGSATLQGIPTYLSRFMMVNPISLVHEAKTFAPLMDVREALNLVYIDPRCPVITPFHVAANRIKEQTNQHGSCGKGIGELGYDLANHPEEILTIGEILFDNCRGKLERIRERKIHELEEFHMYQGLGVKGQYWSESDHARILVGDEVSALAESYEVMLQAMNIPEEPEVFIRESIIGQNLVFEGAQGVLLDEWHGFHPHTTWSNTTPENAVTFLDENGFAGDREIVGIIRSYITRHGNGPMIHFDGDLLAEDQDWGYYHEHNGNNDWQGAFRFGFTDGVMLRYAAAVAKDHGGLDALAITHMDILNHRAVLRACTKYTSSTNNERFRIDYEPSHDLDRQEILGERLNYAFADTFPLMGREEVLEFCSKEAGVQVGYLSNGPDFGSQVICSPKGSGI